MFRANVDVYGTFSHGKLKGQTNPKQVVSLTMFGDTVKAALGKINRECGGATHIVREIRNLALPIPSGLAVELLAA
jgi:hypothetical protein